MLQEPVSSRVIVGRGDELAALDDRWRAAVRGRGSTVLVSGEAGVGKSRLVAEASRGASLVVRGHCFEPDAALPFAPVIDLLRSSFAQQEPAEVVASLGPDAAEIARLLPELSAGALETTPVSEPEKRRLFEALTRYVDRLTHGGPLLLLVEDLHWSDDASLEFLLHLARKLDALPALLIATYRSDEVQPDLERLLATLDRERLAAELRLRRLTVAEVDQMLRSIFDQPQPIRRDFLDEIYALTDGNPFFVEEVVHSLVASGGIYRDRGGWSRKAVQDLQIPRSVQHAVAQRAGRLSPTAREVLQLAAVTGQRFDFSVLQALTDLSEAALLQAIRELINAQLVVEESAERFAFRHALTRQAVYGELLVRERRAIHQTIGETIERLHAGGLDAYLPELSYHFHAAEAWAKAGEYAARAGVRAQELYTPGAAVQHFSRALEAAAALGEDPPPALYQLRGSAYATLGEFERAREDYETVLRLARLRGDHPAEWQALSALGELWSGYDYARAGGYFQEALELARASGDHLTVGRSLVQVGNWQVNTESLVEAGGSLTAALAIFEAAGDRHAIAETYDLLGIVADMEGDLQRMRELLDRATALYRELGDLRGVASTVTTNTATAGIPVFDAIVVPVELARLDVEAAIAESLAITREIGWRAGEAYALLCVGLYRVDRGEFGPAHAALQEGLGIAQEIEHPEWLTIAHCGLGELYRGLLDFRQSRTWLEQALRSAHASGSSHFIHIATGALASAHIAGGDLAGAASVLDGVKPDLSFETVGRRRVWLARAELAMAKGEPVVALDIVDRLFVAGSNVTGRADIPHAAWLQARALIALGRLEEARESLSAAISGATARGTRPLLWQVHLALANLDQTMGHAADAARSLRVARKIINELACTLSDETQRTAFRERALVAFADHDRSNGGGRQSRLTARECDVAALVAQGMTNREIAGTLYVGERTVETHVSHILNKLGYNSRAQIAVWASQSGLLADSIFP